MKPINNQNRKKFRIALLGAAITVTGISVSNVAVSQMVFRNTITGEELDFTWAKKGEETEAVKEFKMTGNNIYHQDKEAIHVGEDLYLTACSGCHGHLAEGKLGPALGDDYYTYPKNSTDKGLFETMFGGARSMMGPQNKNLTIDEMLKIIAWIRSIYWGAPEKADWLTDEEKASFEPAEMPAEYAEALENFKK